LGWIISFEMQAEIVLAAHCTMHQIYKRNLGAFARL
jgi:hypothetical protein